MKNVLTKALLVFALVLGTMVVIPADNAEASVYLGVMDDGRSVYMDETSACKIKDEGLIREFCVNIYIDGTSNSTETVWFYYNGNADSSSYSEDGSNWHDFTVHMNMSDPMSKMFIIAWNRALGYTYC